MLTPIFDLIRKQEGVGLIKFWKFEFWSIEGINETEKTARNLAHSRSYQPSILDQDSGIDTNVEAVEGQLLKGTVFIKKF